MIKTMRRPLGAAVGFLEYPTIVAPYVVLGGVYLALAPFQFVGRIQSRHVGYHRWAGRVLVSIGLVVGLTALHREWTIRAFATALSVATMRLIFIPALIVVADPTQGQLQTLSAASFLVAFVAHASVAEIWIRLTRRRGVPRVSGTETAYYPTPHSG